MPTCTVLLQVGVSVDLYYDARKHKIKRQEHFISTGAGLECLKCPRSSCLTGNVQGYSRIDFIGTTQSGLFSDQRICQLPTAAKGQPAVQGLWCLTSLVTAMTITEIASPPNASPLQTSLCNFNALCPIYVLAYILFCTFSISTSYKQYGSRSIPW